jgi:uncharacterized membrane protein YkgB
MCSQNNRPPVPPSKPPLATAPANAAEFFVPYKNGCAIAAYYLGIFSFIPGIGILLGVPALVLGLKGRRLAVQHPEARGKIHAWVGIIMGGLFGVGQLLLLIFVIVGLLVARSHR